MAAFVSNMAAFAAGCAIVLLSFAVSFGVWYAIVNWGVIPLADAIWDIELPLWPTLIVLWAVTSLLAMIFGRSKVI